MDWQAFRLTLQLACCTTVILFLLGLPLAYWLSTTRWRGKVVLEAIVTLPLVLPPTVLGFYVLIAIGPLSPLGRMLERWTGVALPFSFTGILIGSVLGNVPFAVRPFVAAFTGMDRRLVEASWCLGASHLETFWRVILPLCWPGILAGMVLTFAHAVGEFGVVLMLGGNIPGVTRTLAVSIYDDIQALDYAGANQAAILLVLFSLAILSLTQFLNRKAGSV